MTMNTTIYENPIPAFLRWMGAKWRDGKRSYRMKWGELSFGRPGFGVQLCLFGDPSHFSLNVHLFPVNVFIALPFLRRWAREPEEMMESWGFNLTGEPWSLHLRWGPRYKIVSMPWDDWVHLSHDVRRLDGSWVPYIGVWEGQEPDGRALEQYPYRYLLKSGEKQEVTATVHVERRIWRLRLLRWTSLFQKVRHAIDVEFDGEVGEGAGSWKGGTVGCGYELLPEETAYQCLRRMEQERRFGR